MQFSPHDIQLCRRSVPAVPMAWEWGRAARTIAYCHYPVRLWMKRSSASPASGWCLYQGPRQLFGGSGTPQLWTSCLYFSELANLFCRSRAWARALLLGCGGACASLCRGLFSPQ